MKNLKHIGRRLIGNRNDRLERNASRAYAGLMRSSKDAQFYRAARTARRYAPFGGWSLSVNSLKALIECLDVQKGLKLVEFGSGVSTVFLDSYFGDQIEVDSFEHNQIFADKIKHEISSVRIKVHLSELWQFNDQEYEDILAGEKGYPELYQWGHPVDKKLYLETRLKNTFYKIEELSNTYNAVILDGPNGNGRSLAYAILKDRLTDPAFILIDDCNHYDFIYRCAGFFQFNILRSEIYPGKQWSLLEVYSKRRRAGVLEISG